MLRRCSKRRLKGEPRRNRVSSLRLENLLVSACFSWCLPRSGGQVSLAIMAAGVAQSAGPFQKVKTESNQYLYIFGYRTPEQMDLLRANENAEESSQAVFIEAKSAAQALEWGREISDKYIRLLFGDRPMDWKGMNFVHWVESEPHLEYPAFILENLPVVSYGNYPDFKAFGL